MTHRRQTHPQRSNLGLGEDAPLPTKNHLPAEGPLFQPSPALNLDPAPGHSTPPHHSVTSPVLDPDTGPPNLPFIQLQIPPHLSQPQPQVPTNPGRGLYQIQARPHPGSSIPHLYLFKPHGHSHPLQLVHVSALPATRHQPCIRFRPRDQHPATSKTGQGFPSPAVSKASQPCARELLPSA